MSFQASTQELATLLAALRYWQRKGLNNLVSPEMDIAEDSGPRLDANQIDALCERINTARKTSESAANPFHAFVDRLSKLTTPDLENMTNDETYEKAREFADVIAEAFELTKGTKPPSKPWFGWVATYGDYGLQVEFFETRTPYNDAIAAAEREHKDGDLDSYTCGEEP